jgi:hypothetical protein
MANAYELGQCVREQGCLFKDFYNHHFPTFDGTGGYLSVENWLNDIEELLEATS